MVRYDEPCHESDYVIPQAVSDNIPAYYTPD